MPKEFKDRKTLLIVFGIIQILLGLLLVLLSLVVFISTAFLASEAYQEQAAMYGGTFNPAAAITMAIVIYLAMAVWFIWMGIGSIMARRWARALSLMFSWLWLVVGVATCIFIAVMFPTMNTFTPAAGHSPAVATTVTLFGVALMGFVFIILPLAMILVYNRQDVKLTCEKRDKKECWTDRCPLPVLALCKALVLIGLSTVLSAVFYNWMHIMFGFVLTGIWGALATLATLIFLGYSCYWLYRREMKGWWTALAYQVYITLSTAALFFTTSIDQMYKAMGFGETEIAMMSIYNEQLPWLWLSGLLFLPLIIGYMIYIKRFFVKRGTRN